MTPDMAIGIVLGGLLAIVLLALSAAVLAIAERDAEQHVRAEA